MMNDFKIIKRYKWMKETLVCMNIDYPNIIFIPSMKSNDDYRRIDEYLEMGISITHETIHKLLWVLEGENTCNKWDNVDIEDYISGFSSNKWMNYIKGKYKLFNIKNHWLLGDNN